MPQVICRLAKGQPVKYISHLDWMRTIERALRRARLPVAYSAGYSPHPRLAYTPPLSVGNTSEAELVAVELASPLDPDTVKERLAAALPPGIGVLAAWPAPRLGGKVTFGDFDTAEYRVQVRGPVDPEALSRRLVELMQADHVTYRREREGRVKEFDARPLLVQAELTEQGPGEAALRLKLRLGVPGTLRPEEVLDLLGLGGPEFHSHIHRLALYADQPAQGRASGRQLSRLLPRRR